MPEALPLVSNVSCNVHVLNLTLTRSQGLATILGNTYSFFHNSIVGCWASQSERKWEVKGPFQSSNIMLQMN